MSTDTENQPDQDPELDAAAAGAQEESTEQDPNDAAPDVEVPEYQEFEGGIASGQPGDLARLQNIQITVSAELGRTSIPIQELMELSVGSVMELNREIDSPVKLVAQGVPLAEGEVVVVDGFFAVKVTKVFENQKG